MDRNKKLRLIEKLKDTDKFTNIKRGVIPLLPIQTHIGFIYSDRYGEDIPIISAFVQSHFISQSGQGGMMVKCGNRVYANLYESLKNVFLYNKDVSKITKKIKHEVLHKDTAKEELEARIGRLETVINKLTRSTSQQEIKKPAPKKRNTSITHKEKVKF